MPDSGRLLLVALDGATLDLLGPWMDAGELPCLAALRERGVCGRLTSVIPPVTAAAWPSFMTGKNPGKHGVFEFLLRRKTGGDYHLTPVNSRLREGETIWSLLSRDGKKVVVVNVPVTYPPERVNGCMVSDFLTPMGRRDFTHPPELLAELESKLGPYLLYHVQVYAPGRVEPVLAELETVLDYRRRVGLHLLTEKEWDFAMIHFWGIDRAQHELWHLLDPTHPLHRKREAAKHAGRFRAYYRSVDRAVGDLVAAAGEGAAVGVISDHGFGPIRRFLVFNTWLWGEGFLKLAGRPASLLRRALFRAGITPATGYRMAMRLGLAKLRLSAGVGERYGGIGALVQRFFLSLDDVDWSRTTAYSKGNYGQIHVNLAGREPHGIVQPGEEYERVRGRVIERLRAAKDPATGEPLLGGVWRREEVYEGPYLEYAPDVVFLPRDMSDKALGTLDFISHRFVDPVYGNSGDHRMDGIFFFAGKGVRKGAGIEGARLIDAMPTFLHWMGQPIPDDLDGKVLVDAFEPAFLEERPIRKAAALAEGAVEEEVLSPEEEEEIRRRLKGIGYLG